MISLFKGKDFRVYFQWFDLWVGAYYDRAKKILYLCPLPTLVFEIDLVKAGFEGGL